MLFGMAHLRYLRGVSNIGREHTETIKPHGPWNLIKYYEHTTLSLSLSFARHGQTEIQEMTENSLLMYNHPLLLLLRHYNRHYGL